MALRGMNKRGRVPNGAQGQVIQSPEAVGGGKDKREVE